MSETIINSIVIMLNRFRKFNIKVDNDICECRGAHMGVQLDALEISENSLIYTT